MQLLIDGMTVTVIRKPIKNMNLRVLPPDGVIQITAPARRPHARIFPTDRPSISGEKAAVFVWNQLRGDETPSFAIRTSFCRSIRAIRPHSGRRF